MNITLGPSPGAERHPHHTIKILHSGERSTVRLKQQQIADSRRTLVVEEYGYNPVLYFPPDDVRTDLLEPSDSLSTCPFKGEARYLKLSEKVAASHGSARDIAWYYPAVYNDVAELAGYIAFYDDRVEIISESTHEQ